MKNISTLFACLFTLFIINSVASATERIVQLDVPGCRPCGAAKRLDAIMKKVKAVQKYENKDQSLLIITFDDEKGIWPRL